jgi:hypothetical protein
MRRDCGNGVVIRNFMLSRSGISHAAVRRAVSARGESDYYGSRAVYSGVGLLFFKIGEGQKNVQLRDF